MNVMPQNPSEYAQPASGIRHEIKFVFPSPCAPMLINWLYHYGAPDPAFGYNQIHSLYYDTRDMRSLQEKNESELLKTKIRVRWYTDPFSGDCSSKAFLEIKHKQGNRTFKKRYALELDVAVLNRDPMAAGYTIDLPAYADPQHAERLCRVQPLAVISYRRRRFIEMSTGLRLAVDDRIGVTHVSDCFPFRGGPGRLPEAVLEVKGAGARKLPGVLNLLQNFGLRKTAFSKYAECINRLLLKGG
jgi:hypothetical protein